MAADPGDDGSNRKARAAEDVMNHLLRPYVPIIDHWLAVEWEMYHLLRCHPCPMLMQSRALWLEWRIKEDIANGRANQD